MYEDYLGEAGKGIDTTLYRSVEQATQIAREHAEENVAELTEFGDEEFAPYRVEAVEMGDGLFAFEVVNGHGCEEEGFSVGEFEVEDN